MRSGLAGRIVLLAVALVTVTALATGLATVALAAATARTEQRAEIQAQASLLTLQSVRLVRPRALQRVAARLDGTRVAVYDGAGALVAATAGRRAAVVAATAGAARRAVAGESVSSAVQVAGAEVLVEARPTADGGAFVLTRRRTAFTANALLLIGGVLATLAACLAVAVAAAIWLAARITRSLAGTAAAARRLERGERQVAVPTAAITEVADVGDALRALDAALTTSEGRQREFLLSISHELRTPLTALRGYGEALADGVVRPDRTREVGATLVAETVRLERFTADLLELARLEADDFTVHPTPIDLADPVRETVRAWAARAAEVGVALQAIDPSSGSAALADGRRVRQVLDGLVENALRATPAGGSVLLVVGGNGRQASVAVEDTGPGLSDDDLANAFTRGLLRERYRETRAVGTGLGLSIATRLAARMGGSVTAAHAQGHPGARFTLHLPRS